MIILFGLAGSGKGTQGKALAEILGWRWISNGEVIRQSHRYDEVINRGELIPDAEVIKMMQAEIEKSLAAGQDVIVDGYPRDVAQARYVAENYRDQIQMALVLDVPKEELYQRLALRGREDDKERASIDRRFGIFEQNIYSILSLFKENGIPVRQVNGVGTVEEVTERILATIKNLNKEERHD